MTTTETPAATDWTVNPETGRSNSSPLFNSLCDEVERLIRGDAHKLINGRADMTAGLIMAQLAHVHHLAPALADLDGDPGTSVIVTDGIWLQGGTCATCGNPVPGGGHRDGCTGLVPGSEYRIDSRDNGGLESEK